MSEYDVLIERIDNLKEFFKEEFKQSEKDREGLSLKLVKHEERLKILEDWKLVFVTKFSIYSAIALFLGSLLGTLLIEYLSKFIFTD